MQKQPNRWSCLPTSFAICLGLDVDKVIEEIGHDGSEIIFPDQSEPLKRRGFCDQELFKICIAHRRAVTRFDVELYRYDNINPPYYLFDESNYVSSLLENNIGVLTGTTKSGTPHAVAWDSKYILDPQDLVYTLDLFRLETFYLITIIERWLNNDTFSEENQASYPEEVSTSTTLFST